MQIRNTPLTTTMSENVQDEKSVLEVDDKKRQKLKLETAGDVNKIADPYFEVMLMKTLLRIWVLSKTAC